MLSRETIVLLGDSILDNAPYVPMGQPSVTAQFQAALDERPGWNVCRLAKDGAVMSHVARVQLHHIPADATVLLMSIGGNDGLGALGALRYNFFDTLYVFYKTFQSEYEALIDHIRDTVNIPLVLCTIYQPQMGQYGWVRDTFCSLGVRFMNRVIRNVAAARGIPILDLWTVFSQRADYANAIEPGVPGGHKIVRNFLSLLDKGDHLRNEHCVYDDTTYDPAFAVTIPHVAHFETNRFSAQKQ